MLSSFSGVNLSESAVFERKNQFKRFHSAALAPPTPEHEYVNTRASHSCARSLGRLPDVTAPPPCRWLEMRHRGGVHTRARPGPCTWGKQRYVQLSTGVFTEARTRARRGSVSPIFPVLRFSPSALGAFPPAFLALKCYSRLSREEPRNKPKTKTKEVRAMWR